MWLRKLQCKRSIHVFNGTMHRFVAKLALQFSIKPNCQRQTFRSSDTVPEVIFMFSELENVERSIEIFPMQFGS